MLLCININVFSAQLQNKLMLEATSHNTVVKTNFVSVLSNAVHYVQMAFRVRMNEDIKNICLSSEI